MIKTKYEFQIGKYFCGFLQKDSEINGLKPNDL
jgi:hypothetical protein